MRSTVGKSMSAELKDFTNPTEIVAAGERIYAEKYKANYEQINAGKFVAIDVVSGAAFVADFPEDALRDGRQNSPTGLFHLIKIGSPGAFRVSSFVPSNARSNWLF